MISISHDATRAGIVGPRENFFRPLEAEMGRRHPLTPAEAMPHAMPAWPQALPRGPCDAQPRIYHGPSDFRLWAPSGSTARARNARLLAQALACCLHARRPAFRPLDEGLRGPSKNARALGLYERNRRNPTELRLYINKRFPPFHQAADRLSSLRSRERQHVSPTALSDHVHSPESACINKEYINTFRHAEFVARHDPSRLSRVTPSA